MIRNIGQTNHESDSINNRIDWSIKNEAMNKSKKHKYQQLVTDTGIAKFFLGNKIIKDIYAATAGPFNEIYLKEGNEYPYDTKDLKNTLVYARTLKAVEDVDSDVFKSIYMKKVNKLKDEKISDKDMFDEIQKILTKDIDKDEIQNNKNLQSYLMKCRKPLIGYYVGPSDEKRFTNKTAKAKFKDKVSQHSIEDIALNKLSLMILREYFEAYFMENKSNLGWDNFKIRIANNYDNMMGGTHLIVWFRDAKTGNEKHFALHINMQGSKKKMPDEIIPYDFSSSLNTDGRQRPIKMTMKTLDWGNKELFYNFIGNAIETIKNKGGLDKHDVLSAFNNASNLNSTEHVQKKIIELFLNDGSLAA